MTNRTALALVATLLLTSGSSMTTRRAAGTKSEAARVERRPADGQRPQLAAPIGLCRPAEALPA